MADMMTFPNTVEEFMEQYKVVDTDGVYMSKGSELVPIFRMKQWFEHLPSAQPYTEEQLQKLQDLEQAQLEEAYRRGRESAHQWISCDERLPDPEAKIYWVCTDTGYQCQCRWTNINHFWTDLTVDWHWHIMDVSQYSKVVAWMSLPEPYKENKDERD